MEYLFSQSKDAWHAARERQTQTHIEEIATGITLAFADTGAIAVFTFHHPTPEALDYWAACALELDYCLQPTRQGTLYELDSTSTSLTPYLRRRLTRVLRALPKNPPPIAFVIPRSRLVRQFFQKALQRELNEERADLRIGFFYEERAALQWLKSFSAVAPIT